VILTFYRYVDAADIKIGDTLHPQLIVVDQITRSLNGDDVQDILFRGYRPGGKRRTGVHFAPDALVAVVLPVDLARRVVKDVLGLIEGDFEDDRVAFTWTIGVGDAAITTPEITTPEALEEAGD
jgi:hypothetical protein